MCLLRKVCGIVLNRFGIELFASLQGGVDAAFERSIEGVDMVRSNENDAFVVFQTFQNTKDDG